MASPFEPGRPPDASPGTLEDGRGPLATAVAAAALSSALYIAARATRDALFLTTLGATNLPPAVMASAVLAIGASFGLSLWLRRWSPLHATPTGFVGMAALFAVAWWQVEAAPEVVSVGVYLLVTGLIPVALASFWAVVNERFDPYTAKRMVSHMAAGGALGGVAGGLGAAQLSAAFGVAPLLLVLAAVSVASAAAVRAIGAPPVVVPPPVPRPGEAGLPALWRRPLLRQMAILMFLVSAVETLVEYALNVEAQARFGDATELVRFFALFYTSCGLASFTLQLGLGPLVLRRFGLAAAVVLLPLSVGLAGAVAVGAGRFWGFVLARGAETVVSVSLFRAGFQLLYTPIPNAVRRPAKAWIDVAAGSVGDVVAAGLVFGMLALGGAWPSSWIVSIAVVVCVAAAILVRRIHGSYVAQLSSSLRDGQTAMRVEDALDATTAHTIAVSHVALDRAALLDEVRSFQAGRAGDGPEAVDRGSSRRLEGGERLGARAAALLSDDPDDRRRALADGWSGAALAEAHRLVALVVPLLDDSDLGEAAARFLRRVGHRAIGQLLDAALDASEPRERRLSLLAILADQTHPRALEGLIRALGDEDFEVRFAAARAAARLVHRSKAERPPTSEVLRLVEQELGCPDTEWTHNSRRPGRDDRRDRSVLIRGRALQDVPRSLEHVFTLLALVNDRAVMASTLTGLTSGNPALRGTAMEYLESTLPPSLRRPLWKRIDAPSPKSERRRTRDSMADELLRTQVDWVVDRAELDAHREAVSLQEED